MTDETTQPGESPGTASIPTEAEQLQAELELWRERVLRLQAELDNQRKRFEKQLAEARLYGVEDFARNLLPVRDSLEHGLAAADQGGDVVGLREGMALTLTMLSQLMLQFGISEINPLDELFDPRYHEAMSVQPDPQGAPNRVLLVQQKGYRLGEHLLRPARVVVAAPVESDQT